MIQVKEKQRVLLDEVKINWFFTERETDVFRAMWNDRENIETIAKQLRRPALEVVLLVIEQAELENIKERRHGLF
ncbi:hypothetical protein [Sporosarcina sp. FA9]|uniref:hypothetical protein n=1 Tax=Sporosarcina sp. FA9 TaxID=3413030 RepID=UPI003F6563FB